MELTTQPTRLEQFCDMFSGTPGVKLVIGSFIECTILRLSFHLISSLKEVHLEEWKLLWTLQFCWPQLGSNWRSSMWYLASWIFSHSIWIIESKETTSRKMKNHAIKMHYNLPQPSVYSTRNKTVAKCEIQKSKTATRVPRLHCRYA